MCEAMSKNGKAYLFQDEALPLAHYPHIREAGGFLFVSGISARKPDGTIEGNTIEEQTKAVLEKLKALLQKVGADLESLVDVTVYLLKMEDYADYNKIYNLYFTPERGPTRTTVAVKALPEKNILIEIKAMALAPSAVSTKS